MDGLIIGLDLNDDYTQLCCAGQEKSWTFPTVVCRRKEAEVWLTGKEAYAATLLGEGVIVDKLLKLAARKGTSTIGGICYGGASLLTRFVEQILEYPKREFGSSHIRELVVTVQEVSEGIIDCLRAMARELGIEDGRFHIMSHTESFIYYVLSQKRDLWTNQVGLFELSADRLYYYEMKVQRGLKRNIVQAEGARQEESFNLDILSSPSGSRLADKILCSCGDKLLGRKLFSTVFLTGKGFERQDWAGDFMRMACRRRKVFVEGCLFARGAALRGEDDFNRESAYPYIMICDGRLKTEVSLEIARRGKECQLVVASYGDCWYETKRSLRLIADSGDELAFTVSYLGSKKKKIVKFPLAGFPERPPRTTGLELSLSFKDERTMVATVEDRGFGELFPATEASLSQEVTL